MRFIAVCLEKNPRYLYSGKSVNVTPMRHIRRTLTSYELFFVQEGELYMSSQKEEFCVKKGEVLFQVKGEPQSGTRYSENTFYWLHLEGEVRAFESREEAESFCAQGKDRVYFPEHFALCNVERITVLLAQLNQYREEQSREIVQNALTAALLAEFSRQHQQTPTVYADSRFAELMAFVALNITAPLSLTGLAERFSYNPKYLSRIFHKNTGETFKQYLNKRRLEIAKRLLCSESGSVKYIARAVGFEDEYYFMRAFKKATGISPKNFRLAYSANRYT